MKKDNDFKNLTRGQIAKIVGRSEKTITRWLSEGLPRNKNGSYTAAAVVSWLEGRARDAATADMAMVDTCGGSPALERYREARAEREELALAKERAALMSAEEAQSAWTARYVEIVSSLSHLGHRLAGVLPGKDAEQVIKLVSQEVQVLQWAMVRRSRYCETAAQEVEVLQAFENAHLEFVYTGIGYGNSAGRTSLLDPAMEFETWRANYLKEKEAGR